MSNLCCRHHFRASTAGDDKQVEQASIPHQQHTDPAFDAEACRQGTQRAVDALNAQIRARKTSAGIMTISPGGGSKDVASA